MRMNRLALAMALTPTALVFAFACGEGGTNGGSGSAGSAGSPASGGSGGQSTQTGGTTTVAGMTATGGSLTGNTAGAPAGGSPAGSSGAPATGGSPSAGSGGTPSSGGASGGSGGTDATGGTGTGGEAAGSAGEGGTDGGTGGSGPQTCPYTPPEDPETFPKNWTRSKVTVFNDNGAWTWYNDERIVVDAEAGKIVLSTAASTANNQSAMPQIHAVIHDLATGMNSKTTLGSLSYSDDHNNGGIVITGPGKYFVGWAHHNVDCLSHWRTYENGMWSQEQTYRWNNEGCPWGSRPDNITYNNPWKMSTEGRYYNFVRSIQTSPNFLLSEDDGKTWKYGGRLTASPQQGYNAGYYKYWGNGVDRIDFFATEAHPRDADTSVYHGYIKGGKSYDSFDKEIDGNIFDGNAPQITAFTKVFSTGGMVNGVRLRCLWNFDIARYDDGSIAVLWQARESNCGEKNDNNAKHRILYSRFDGTKWTATYLVRGGRTLYRNRSDWWEEDYLGGAALDPDNPHVIYVSTPVDPRDDTTVYPNHEIWKGVTCDNGATFKWEPLTMNSEHENLRPAVPKWDGRNSVVAWFRGNYQTAQMFDAETVGIITRAE